MSDEFEAQPGNTALKYKGLISAIQFITRLPIGKPGTFEPDEMVQFFPAVGLMLGIILVLFDALMLHLWSQPVAALLDVILLIWLTGAFHLDGLGDSADGLYGVGSKEKALEIMKDSRIGSMALVVVTAALAVKWGGLADMTKHRSLMLLIIPAYARGSMLFGFRFLEYGRPGGGTGHALFEKKLEWSSFWGLSVPFVLSLFAGGQGIVLNITFFGVTACLLQYYKKRMGCITGDMLGAMTEVLESALFLTAAMTIF